MTKDTLSKPLKQDQKEGRKKRGRPRVKWEENIRRGLQERGVDWRQARKKAMDRSAWKVEEDD
jgi:hypothetical protein